MVGGVYVIMFPSNDKTNYYLQAVAAASLKTMNPYDSDGIIMVLLGCWWVGSN